MSSTRAQLRVSYLIWLSRESQLYTYSKELYYYSAGVPTILAHDMPQLSPPNNYLFILTAIRYDGPVTECVTILFEA